MPGISSGSFVGSVGSGVSGDFLGSLADAEVSSSSCSLVWDSCSVSGNSLCSLCDTGVSSSSCSLVWDSSSVSGSGSERGSLVFCCSFLDVSNFPQGFFFLSGNRNPLLLVDTGEVAWLEVPDRGLVLVFFLWVAVLYEGCRLVNYRWC